MHERYNSLNTDLGGIAFKDVRPAFSWKSRQAIKERDGNRCVDCGSPLHLECAHYDHNKSSSRYDDPSNGRVLCVEDHLADHISREGKNGLTKEGNRWAVNKIWERLVEQSSDR